MSNPLYQMMAGQGMPAGGNIIQRFMQFKNSFRGDPQQTIRQMMASGKVSQEQYNRAVQTAQQIQRMLGGK